MVRINTVLCPVDFSDVSVKEVNLALEVCRVFDARLVLHHNLAVASPGYTKAWEWEGEHRFEKESEAQAEKHMRDLLASLPAGVRVQASITSGPVGTVLLGLSESLPADLLVLGSHGWSTPDHASVSERMIDRCPCPVLTIQEAKVAEHSLRLRPSDGAEEVPVVVATDLSDSADAALAYAFDIARMLPLRIHLLHVVSGSPGATAEAHQKLELLVPPELEGRTECHVEAGHPVERILSFVDRIEPGFVIMGEHARSFFRRLFTRDTAREILHRASFPVWFVPAAYKG